MSEILVVDEDRQIRELLQTVLCKNGYCCRFAENSEQARNLLTERDFDLLITDICTQGESAADFTKNVSNKYPKLAVIIITANDDPQTADALLRAGAYGYIVKPFKCNQVLITVVNALIRRELEIEARFVRDDLEKAVHHRTVKLTQLEQKLKASEEKMRQTLDNIGIGVALISPEMKLLEMNRQMQDWFPNIAIDNQPLCIEVFHTSGRTHPCSNCPTIKALQDGKVHEANIETSISGGIHTFRVVATPIHDSSGTVMAAIEMVEDITAKLAMERELLQTQKLASIGQLAAGVTHEINNPVAFVSSNLTTLGGYHNDLNRLIRNYQAFKQSVAAHEDPAGLPEVKAGVGRIESIEDEIDIDFVLKDVSDLLEECIQGTERIKKIVEDLKHFAHPGQDKVQDTDINGELESMLNVVHNELKYKATVTKTFGELPTISANSQQLNQVFVNILVNAAQSIEKSGEIKIQTQHIDGHVEIRISDTGCGIPKESLSRIFDPFFTTKEVGKGTGLGLNIAFNIIKKHRGEMLVQSQEGRGTTFIIKLPVSATVPATGQADHNKERWAC